MSDFSQGPGWWQASDGKWYPPQPPSPPPPGQAQPQIPVWGAPAPSPYQVYNSPGFGSSGLPSVQGQAVASLVLGICGVVLCFCSGFVSVVLGLIGLPFGVIALQRINKGEADPGPKGLAIGGIACSSVALALGVVYVVILVAAFGSSSV